jgi:hypothetical protein
LIVSPGVRVPNTAGLANDLTGLAPRKMHRAQHWDARSSVGWRQQQSAQTPKGGGAQHQRLPPQPHQICFQHGHLLPVIVLQHAHAALQLA